MPVRAVIPAHDGVVFQLGRWLRALAVMACVRLLRWHELSRQRRALLALNERMLKDIGISRGEAVREARRPFWRDGLDRPPEPLNRAPALGAGSIAPLGQADLETSPRLRPGHPRPWSSIRLDAIVVPDKAALTQ
jgi:uncharacterized protein YjiS (DUF1127 family)